MNTREKAEKEALKEIVEKFNIKDIDKEPDAEFFKNCAKINAFLTDEKTCGELLKKLNKLLEEKQDKEKPLTVNLLRSTLEEELARFGFHPLFAKVIDELKPFEFRSALREKFALKDVTLDGHFSHGELSHAMQWLLISWEQERNPNFLSQKVVDIYQQMGSDRAVYQTSPKEKNMWDLVVDRILVDNFSCPDYFRKYFKETKEPGLDTLKKLLNMRTDKRKMNEIKSWNEVHKHDGGIVGKHTIFKKDEKNPSILIPVKPNKPGNK